MTNNFGAIKKRKRSDWDGEDDYIGKDQKRFKTDALSALSVMIVTDKRFFYENVSRHVSFLKNVNTLRLVCKRWNDWLSLPERWSCRVEKCIYRFVGEGIDNVDVNNHVTRLNDDDDDDDDDDDVLMTTTKRTDDKITFRFKHASEYGAVPITIMLKALFYVMGVRRMIEDGSDEKKERSMIMVNASSKWISKALLSQDTSLLRSVFEQCILYDPFFKNDAKRDLKDIHKRIMSNEYDDDDDDDDDNDNELRSTTVVNEWIWKNKKNERTDDEDESLCVDRSRIQKKTLVIGVSTMFNTVRYALATLNHLIFANMLTEPRVKIVTKTKTLISKKETCARAMRACLKHVPFFDRAFPLDSPVWSLTKRWNKTIVRFRKGETVVVVDEPEEGFANVFRSLSDGCDETCLSHLFYDGGGERSDGVTVPNTCDRLFYVRSPEYDVFDLMRPASKGLFDGQIDRTNAYKKYLNTFEKYGADYGMDTNFILRFVQTMLRSDAIQTRGGVDEGLTHVIWISEGILNIKDDLRWFTNTLRMIQTYYLVALKKNNETNKVDARYDDLSVLLMLFDEKLNRFKDVLKKRGKIIKKSTLMNVMGSLSLLGAIAMGKCTNDYYNETNATTTTTVVEDKSPSYENSFHRFVNSIVNDTIK